MISVCMTSYNGEKYIGEQIDSVLLNLSKEDELVVSDDGSRDRTPEILRKYEEKDPRVKLFHGPGKGINANFDFAIRQTKGEIIFICDQDDIWEKDKVKEVLKAFSSGNYMAVVHDCNVIDDDEKEIIPSFMKYHGSAAGAIKNIIKNSYIGCCMAFRRELLDVILPIPTDIEMYDQWIGVWADLKGGSYFYEKILFHYRRHGENASSMHHYGIQKMIRNRVVFLYRLLQRKSEMRKSRPREDKG
jgi:glycosyltransferase involved in cell wall biosynthesis